MPKQKIFANISVKFRAIVLVVLALGIASSAAVTHADQYDDQINGLQAQNNATQGVLNGLESQASSYQEVINQLQAQIDATQAALTANEAQQASLQQQITDAQNKVIQEKKYLGEDIKAMYIDGQLSTIEELATSKSLSDYVDKEEYRTSVQNKIDATIKEIAALQAQLQKQKADLDVLVASEQQQRDQLAATQNQQQNMLAYNQGQQDAYNAQIKSNSGQIAELRRQQIAANARFIGGAGSGPACGGGYPAKWCEIAQDTVIDNWGMYNRECVSYTAFRVAASGRVMPYWGGRGNANQWDDDARADGIPVDGSPRAGDVAISNAGAFGHAMYVEAVNGDGTIFVSQYNAALDGRYSTKTISVGSLVFIHF
jgi:surface antigen/peptidoglycan hydrolase CwlO-like protein